MGVLKGTASTLGGIGRAGMGLVGIGGSIAAGAAIGSEMGERARASQLANQAGRPELKGQLLQEGRGVRGFSGMEGLNAMGKFVDITGDLDAARRALPELGKLALATGTEFDELAAAAGNAFIPLSDQIQDPKKRLDALMSTMRSIAGMGGVGAVEIKDLATEMAGLAAATNKFKGDPADLMKSVTAMAQAARQRGGAASAAEAVTSVSRFTMDAVNNADKFKRAGVNVFADKGKTKLADPQEIMVQMLRKTGGDLTKVNKLFGVYGERAVAGFSPLYTQAGGGQAGEDAVRAEFKRLKAAELTPAQMEQRAGSRMGDADVKFKEAMKNFNAAVGKELLPVVTQLLARFTELTPEIGKAAKSFADLLLWLASNPWKGLGVVVAASLAKEIAVAKIPTLIERLIKGSGGSSGVPKVPGSGGSGGSGLGKSVAIGGAIAGTALAVDQASKLQRETGMRTSLADVLPGYKGGKFDSERLLTDLANPFALPNKIGAFAGEAVGKMTGREIKGSVRGVVGQANRSEVMSEASARTALVQPDDVAAVTALAAQAKVAAAELAKIGSAGPGRGNTPSPVK